MGSRLLHDRVRKVTKTLVRIGCWNRLCMVTSFVHHAVSHAPWRVETRRGPVAAVAVLAACAAPSTVCRGAEGVRV